MTAINTTVIPARLVPIWPLILVVIAKKVIAQGWIRAVIERGSGVNVNGVKVGVQNSVKNARYYVTGVGEQSVLIVCIPVSVVEHADVTNVIRRY